MPMFTAPVMDYGQLEPMYPGISDEYGSWSPQVGQIAQQSYGQYFQPNYNWRDPGQGLGSTGPYSLPSYNQPTQVRRSGIPFGERLRLAFDPTYSVNQSPWKNQLLGQQGGAPEQAFLGNTLGGNPAMSAGGGSTAYPTWGQTGYDNTPLYNKVYPDKAGRGLSGMGGGGSGGMGGLGGMMGGGGGGGGMDIGSIMSMIGSFGGG